MLMRCGVAMTTPTRLTVSIALLVGVASPHAVQAQPADARLKDITVCMQIANSSEKYACYLRLEAEVRAALPPTATPTQPTVPPAVANTPAPTSPSPSPSPSPSTSPSLQATGSEAVASFGNQQPTAASVQANAKGEQELHDRITNLQEREPGRFLITLASGQVWYQSNSQRFRLREGMAVRIYPSPLGGSFRMARDDGEATGFVQVERIR